ncbi:hypothetical protein BX616_004043, partial [Lobosporangium transversale]
REQEAFENVVEVEMNRSKNTWHWDKDTWDWNKYESHLGKVTITLRSRNAAREFYNALTNAKHVYEMDIALFWYWTRTDLKALEKALKVSNVSVLRLNLEQPQENACSHHITSQNEVNLYCTIFGYDQAFEFTE